MILKKKSKIFKNMNIFTENVILEIEWKCLFNVFLQISSYASSSGKNEPDSMNNIAFKRNHYNM